MTSFNYGDKKARDVGLTCRCHLTNIMPESIFYDSMGWGDDSAVVVVVAVFLFVCLFVCFLRDGNRYLYQHRRDGFSLIIITPVGVGKP